MRTVGTTTKFVGCLGGLIPYDVSSRDAQGLIEIYCQSAASWSQRDPVIRIFLSPMRGQVDEKRVANANAPHQSDNLMVMERTFYVHDSGNFLIEVYHLRRSTDSTQCGYTLRRHGKTQNTRRAGDQNLHSHWWALDSSGAGGWT